ncbi:MAG: 1-deoxy-D-xylulose-5-phosphate reductoisomerase [Acidobacteriota bacterium]
MRQKRIAILGSTGSVGTQALQVVERHEDRLQVVGLAAGGNVDALAHQVQRWRPQVVSLASEADARALRRRSGSNSTRVVWGEQGLRQVTLHPDIDLVLNAVVGAAGLPATYDAVVAGKTVGLANKESMVMAGELIMEACRHSGAIVLPVDSEPNALHQCLRGTRSADVRRLILTASGGPFLGWPAERLSTVTPEEALRHPTWQMGRRISIDSATMMNKGFEIIESHWLFRVPAEAIDVVIHPQSVVHSLVEFVDGSLIAQAGPTDMRLPIQDAFSYPDRWQPVAELLELPRSSPWTFQPTDSKQYPALGLAREALAIGGTAPATINAADEVAVEAFLRGELRFDQITAVVAAVLANQPVQQAASIDEVCRADATARRAARAQVSSICVSNS